MKVVFVNRYFYPDTSATSQMLTDLCAGLAGQDFQVHVITSRLLHQDASVRLPATEQVGDARVHRVWTSRFGRAALPGRAVDYATFYIFAALKLALLLRREDVVVVKTDPPMMSVLCAPVAAVRGATLINWLQDVFPEVALQLGAIRQGALMRLLIRLRNGSLRRARFNVVLGSRMARTLLAEGIPRQQIRVLPNWSKGVLRQHVSGTTNALRRRLQVERQMLVVYSGNLGRAHDFVAILEAASLLAGDPDITLLMIGGGSGMASLRQTAEKRGLRNLLFEPAQPREFLSTSLAAADVHLVSLLPGLEGLVLPSKLYGIFAAGRPSILIGDPSGEVARLLTHHDCGTVVAAGDGEALAAKLRVLRNSPEYRIRQGLNAHALYDRRYTAELAVARWKQLLQR